MTIEPAVLYVVLTNMSKKMNKNANSAPLLDNGLNKLPTDAITMHFKLLVGL